MDPSHGDLAESVLLKPKKQPRVVVHYEVARDSPQHNTQCRYRASSKDSSKENSDSLISTLNIPYFAAAPRFIVKFLKVRVLGKDEMLDHKLFKDWLRFQTYAGRTSFGHSTRITTSQRGIPHNNRRICEFLQTRKAPRLFKRHVILFDDSRLRMLAVSHVSSRDLPKKTYLERNWQHHLTLRGCTNDYAVKGN